VDQIKLKLVDEKTHQGQSIKTFYGLDKLLVLTQKNKVFFQLFEIKLQKDFNPSIQMLQKYLNASMKCFL
jgi:hypothetical protein